MGASYKTLIDTANNCKNYNQSSSFSEHFKGRKNVQITVDFVNEVIQDISDRDSNTLNIMMIDELININSKDCPEYGENIIKSDWSKLDVSKSNIFLLVAFNPSGDSRQIITKFQIQTPGYDITNIQENIKETIKKCGETVNKTIYQQLHVGYRSVKPIADLANYFINHPYGGKYKYTYNFE